MNSRHFLWTYASTLLGLAAVTALGQSPQREPSAQSATASEKHPAPATLAGIDFLAVPGSQYQLAWNDEFDGAALDTGKWSIGLPWGGSEDHRWHNDQYASYVTDEDVTVAGGELHLTCRKADIQGKTRLFHYTEGLITSSGKYDFTYGYAEIRAKAPLEAGKGMWPAFWTLSSGWPPECDIIEVWTSEPRIHQGYCWAKPGGGQQWNSYHAKTAPAGYHTYGMEWGPGYIFFNLDGKVTRRVYGSNVTNQPQYLILNSGVGSGKGNIGPDERSVFPNSFDVQYCRVYQRRPAAVLHNGDFEYADHWPWITWGEASVVSERPHQGSHAMRVAAGATAEQTLYGLTPNTTYELAGWIQVEKAGEQAFLGVKGHGDAQLLSTVSDSTYTHTAVRFRTGATSTTAVVFCYKPSGTQEAYFDDLSLTMVQD